MLKQYKGRESIPVSDFACVVQSVHSVEQDNESDVVFDNFVLCNSYVLRNLEKKLCHLSLPQREEMAKVIMKFTEIFSDVPGRANCVLHDVNVGNSEPIKQNPEPKKVGVFEEGGELYAGAWDHSTESEQLELTMHLGSRVIDPIAFVQIIGR